MAGFNLIINGRFWVITGEPSQTSLCTDGVHTEFQRYFNPKSDP
jgi:hypothetical protein